MRGCSQLGLLFGYQRPSSLMLAGGAASFCSFQLGCKPLMGLNRLDMGKDPMRRSYDVLMLLINEGAFLGRLGILWH